MLAIAAEVCTVTSDGFITAQLPAAMALTSGAVTMDNG